MRDTQPLCRKLIGRCGHGALAPFVTREHECRRRGTRTISVESQRGWKGRESRCRTDTNERYRGIARSTVGPPRSLEHVAFFKLLRRGTPVTRNFTSTPTVIGHRRVTILDYFRTSVGDIATDETFLIQSILIRLLPFLIMNAIIY